MDGSIGKFKGPVYFIILLCKYGLPRNGMSKEDDWDNLKETLNHFHLEIEKKVLSWKYDLIAELSYQQLLSGDILKILNLPVSKFLYFLGNFYPEKGVLYKDRRRNVIFEEDKVVVSLAEETVVLLPKGATFSHLKRDLKKLDSDFRRLIFLRRFIG